MKPKLDPANVPDSIVSLLPMAKQWGISDDGYRVHAVESASNEELLELVHCLDVIDEQALWDWLAGPEADSTDPTNEYVAFTCLTMAMETAQSVIEERGLLEM